MEQKKVQVTLLSTSISAWMHFRFKQRELQVSVRSRVEPPVMRHTKDRVCHIAPEQQLLSSMSCPLGSQFVLSSHCIFSLSLVVLSQIRSHLHPVFVDFLFTPCSHERCFLICNGTSRYLYYSVVRYTVHLINKLLTTFFGKRFDVFPLNYPIKVHELLRQRQSCHVPRSCSGNC